MITLICRASCTPTGPPPWAGTFTGWKCTTGTATLRPPACQPSSQRSTQSMGRVPPEPHGPHRLDLASRALRISQMGSLAPTSRMPRRGPSTVRPSSPLEWRGRAGSSGQRERCRGTRVRDLVAGIGDGMPLFFKTGTGDGHRRHGAWERRDDVSFACALRREGRQHCRSRP